MTWGIQIVENGKPLVIRVRFETEEQAQMEIEYVLMTMHPKRLDPRWVDAYPVEV
jgi:hypothetical protein